ncbi:hypothetical protein B0T22DRAFT_476197 [Podospora appendiculata]|uniref:Fork-head domain-containing protein n=1 Tax=Podospora appendiculata TaxID=314037 RepID=A0AAE0XH96_9PEZI|nr:hypothetical protein B0T22DRAFT_476197 [Podospora appendiculata]
MTGTLQSPCESGQAPYIPTHAQEEPLWNACLRAQTGGDDFEHYTFNRASTTGMPQRDSISGQSSPRSWTSSERFRPAAPWDENLPEPYLQNHYPRQDMQAAGLQRRHGECFFQGNPSMLSPPYPPTGPAYLQTQSFDGPDGSIILRTQPESGFQTHHYSPLHLSAGGLPAMIDPGSYPLSPRSSTLELKMDDEMLSATPTSDPGDVFVCSSSLNGQYHRMGPSGLRSSPPSPVPSAPDASGCSPGILANSKNEEPYARLIYRAFMSTAPSYSMTLQEIYQWFRDNTDKGRSDSKGWQNSIRHNLSMNRAFTKSERKSAAAGDAEDATGTSAPEATSAEAAAASPEPCPPASPDATGTTAAADNKKSTKWYLEPWAINAGVQSTTRYRKGNQSRHGRSASSRGGSGSGSATRSSKEGCTTTRAMGSSSSAGRRSTISTSRFKNPRPAPLRSAGPMHQMHHRFQVPHRPHHMHSNDLHMHDLSAYNPFMNGGGGGGRGGGGGMARPAGPAHLVDFPDYTDPQLVFSSNGTPSPHQHMMRRADSEHSVDEPVTPEQSFAPPPMGEAGLLLPNLRNGGGVQVAGPSSSASSSSSSNDPFYSSTTGHHHHNHHHGGIDLSNYTLPDSNGVGVHVYDPDRYGWAAAAAGVDGASAAYQQHY